MSAAVFIKNLPRCFANRGFKLPKLACIQERKNSSGSILKKAENPNPSNDEVTSCYKDVCVGEGVVFPKPEQIAATDAINSTNFTGDATDAINYTNFTGDAATDAINYTNFTGEQIAATDAINYTNFTGEQIAATDAINYTNLTGEQIAATDAINYTNFTGDAIKPEETKSVDKAWVDNTVQEVFIHDNNAGSDIVCEKEYCVGEGVAFPKSSVEPNFAPLFDMFDKGVICNGNVCVGEGVVFSRDELEDVATQPVDEKMKKKGADGLDEKVEDFYIEVDILDFDNSGNVGNVYWSPAGRKAVDVDLMSPLVDVFDKGMVCNEKVCVGEGVVFSKDQFKDTSSPISNDSVAQVSAKKD